MNKDQKEKALTWLKENYKGCSNCKSDNFVMKNDTVKLDATTNLLDVKADIGLNLYHTPKHQPMICAVCKDCASISLFCAITIGLVSYDEPKTQKKGKILKSLAEHNAQASTAQWDSMKNKPALNGIACPYCSKELYDSNPMETFTSMPAQKKTHCTNCSYTGYRIV